MKVSLAQVNSTIGAISQNEKRVIQSIEEARRAGSDIIVFPELVLIGYPPRDLLEKNAFIEENLQALRRVASATKGITAVVGFVERNPNGTGKPYFNSAALLEEGQHTHTYRKQLLPYYDVFEEERYFESGTGPGVFQWKGKQIGISICEDAWNLPGFLPRLYSKEPLTSLRGKRLDLMVNLSASPFSLGKSEQRLLLFRELAKQLGCSVAVCNAVGANDELIFDGGSALWGKDETLRGVAPVFEEGIFTFETETGQTTRISPWPESDPEWHFEALSLGLRDYLCKTGQKQVVLGLSGGIDSSVVAAIAVHALGSEKVIGVCLPSRFTATESTEDALALAARLGIQTTLCAGIEDTVTVLKKELSNALKKDLLSLTQENIQPRVRMTFLMAIANETQSLLLNTSNKSEIAMGFATLYGDSAGALSVVGDLVKEEVYALAKFINAAGELIPVRVLNRPPTAELKENQKDEDVLPPYPELDKMVRGCVVQGLPADQISGVSDKTRETFSRMHHGSEFKRRQLPPVLRVSPKAFGIGRRFPIATR